jgi:hypothetical protein
MDVSYGVENITGNHEEVKRYLLTGHGKNYSANWCSEITIARDYIKSRLT